MEASGIPVCRMGVPRYPLLQTVSAYRPCLPVCTSLSHQWHQVHEHRLPPAVCGHGASSLMSCDSMRCTFSCHPDSSSKRIEAQATAHAKGLPMKVGPCMNAPGAWLEIISAIPVAGQHGRKRHVSTGQCFAYTHDIGFYIGMLPSK